MKTEWVHHLLLDRGDGRFALIVWHEVTCEDGSTKPRRQFVPPAMPCTLTLADPNAHRVAVVLQWDDAGQPRPLAVPCRSACAVRGY